MDGLSRSARGPDEGAPNRFLDSRLRRSAVTAIQVAPAAADHSLSSADANSQEAQRCVLHLADPCALAEKLVARENIVRFLLRKLKIHCLETNLNLRRTECQTLSRQFDLPDSTPEHDAFIKLRWASAMEETRALQLKLQSLLGANQLS
jgi:hypothetical protein